MKLSIFFLLFATITMNCQAQKMILSVGSTSALTIKSGTIFSADSLVLIPGPDFTLSTNAIQESPVAVNFVPNPSINRVYNIVTPIVFTGTIQLYYQPSELNGNTESALEYTDSTLGGTWVSESTSTVNTSLHYVQFGASSQSFNGATASQPIIPLPLTLISFTGNWNQQMPALEWIVSQTGEVINYDVESCSDGVSWKTIGEVEGTGDNGMNVYQFNDNNPSSNIMYYRIKLLEGGKQFSYSFALKLEKGDDTNSIRLVAANGGVSVYFVNTLPTAFRIVNISGQVLRNDLTSRQEYDVNGLMPGVYFIQYELNGQWFVRKFIVP